MEKKNCYILLSIQYISATSEHWYDEHMHASACLLGNQTNDFRAVV